MQCCNWYELIWMSSQLTVKHKLTLHVVGALTVVVKYITRSVKELGHAYVGQMTAQTRPNNCHDCPIWAQKHYIKQKSSVSTGSVSEPAFHYVG